MFVVATWCHEENDSSRSVAVSKRKNLAWFRVAFAAIAIAVIQLNPATISRFPLLSRVVLGCFLLSSLAILFATVRRSGSFQKIGLAAICLDLIWVSLIIFSTGGVSTPFFVYYFFPVITAGSFYEIKEGLSAALIGIGIYGFIRFTLKGQTPSVSIILLSEAFI